MRFTSALVLLFLAWCLSAPLALTRVAAADVLWDQYGDSYDGWRSQDFETAYDCYDCWAADDFYVKDAAGWYVKDIHWDSWFSLYGYATVRQVNFYIWPVRADGLADFYNPVWTESGLAGETLYDGENQYDVTNVAALAGHTTYWLGIQAAMDFDPWGGHYWIGHEGNVYGKQYSMINPNGCFGMGSDWWAPIPDYSANFRITGDIIPEPRVISLAGLLLGAGALCLKRRK